MYIYVVGIGRRIREADLKQLAGHSGDYSRVQNFKKIHGILEGLKAHACGKVLLVPCFATRVMSFEHLLKNMVPLKFTQ